MDQVASGPPVLGSEENVISPGKVPCYVICCNMGLLRGQEASLSGGAGRSCSTCLPVREAAPGSGSDENMK